MTERDLVFLRMAEEGAQISKCPRQKIGAVLVNKDGRIKGYGYNGTVAGQPNLCGGDFCLRDGEPCSHCCGDGSRVTIGNFPMGTARQCEVCNGEGKINSIKSGTQNDIGCIHAEANLIINCSREDLLDGTIYVSGEPCLFCAKLVAQTGIRRLVYRPGGYTTSEGIEFLDACGITCYHPIASQVEGGDLESR